MRVDSPALSGKGSQTSSRTSGGGWSHEEILEVASWLMSHSERHQFPRALLIRTRFPETSLNVTLWMKSQHKEALTPPCIIQKNPQVPNTARQVACHPVNNSRGKRSSISQQKTRRDSLVPTLQGPCDPSQKWRGTLRFLPPLFHCTKPSGAPRGPSQLHSIPDFSEAP